LNRDQIVKIARLTGCKNFVNKRKKFIFNAFVDQWRDLRMGMICDMHTDIHCVHKKQSQRIFSIILVRTGEI